MKRALVLASACLLLTHLTGCTGDPREAEIKRMVAALEEASQDITNINDAIKEAVKKAQADPEKKELNEDGLKGALEAIETLKRLGVKFRNIKARIDSFSDLPTDEQKAALVKDNKDDIERAVDHVAEAQKRLEDTLRESAPYIHRDAMESLRAKLREAQEQYLNLGQRA